MAFRRPAAASIGVLSVFVLGIGVVAARESGTAEPRDAGTAISTLAASLPQLDLSTLQHARIERLFGAEERRLVALREVWTDLDAALRRAELQQPFDEDLVSSLVAQQAELAGYARGAESRIVSSILSLLTPEQSHRFVELRLGHVDQLALFDGA